jgi:hypothetical protein
LVTSYFLEASGEGRGCIPADHRERIEVFVCPGNKRKQGETWPAGQTSMYVSFCFVLLRFALFLAVALRILILFSHSPLFKFEAIDQPVVILSSQQTGKQANQQFGRTAVSSRRETANEQQQVISPLPSEARSVIPPDDRDTISRSDRTNQDEIKTLLLSNIFDLCAQAVRLVSGPVGPSLYFSSWVFASTFCFCFCFHFTYFSFFLFRVCFFMVDLGMTLVTIDWLLARSNA